MNSSKEHRGTLPKIKSQKRVYTAIDIKEEIGDKVRHNSQMKRSFSATNTNKPPIELPKRVYKTKTIEELENQKKYLDKEIHKVEKEIQESKRGVWAKEDKTNSRPWKKEQTFLTETSHTVDSQKPYRKNIDMNNEKELANEIKLSENKAEIMRKKIDEQREKNEKTKKEIDAVRREIVTLKNKNKNLQNSLQKTTEEYSELCEISRTLEQEIIIKNNIAHKTKIETQHKKAEVVRQYDEILGHLQQELNKNKNNKKTLKKELNATSSNSIKFSQASRVNDLEEKKRKTNITINKNKSMASQIALIKSKLEKYELEIAALKNETGVESTEEAIQEFQEKYDKNFGFYQYINELSFSLEEKQKENKNLKDKKEALMEEVSAKLSDVKYKEVVEIQSQIEEKRRERERYTEKSKEYEKELEDIKEIIAIYYSKIGLKSNLKIEELNEESIPLFLNEIRERCQELDKKFYRNYEKSEQEYRTEVDLGEVLSNVQKESIHENTEISSERLMSRDEFMKAREILMKKGKTPKKGLSKK